MTSNKTISYSGKIGTMTVEGERLCITWEDGQRSLLTHDEMLKARSDRDSRNHEWGRRLAFFEANRPKKLASDEVATTGPRRLVLQLRWHDGLRQFRHASSDDSWSYWRWHAHLNEFERKCEQWFRDNCPDDVFVTDQGEVLRFVMQDDGEACVDGESKYLPTLSDLSHAAHASPFRTALYNFRNKERARWSLELGNVWGDAIVFIYRDRKHAAHMDARNPVCPNVPAWVNKKAADMLQQAKATKEKSPEKRPKQRQERGTVATVAANRAAQTVGIEFDHWVDIQPGDTVRLTIDRLDSDVP